MADASDLEKNEQPTDTKLKKAKEKGQIPRSRELSSMVLLLVGIGMFYFIGNSVGINLTRLMQRAIISSHQYLGDDQHMVMQFIFLLKAGFATILPIIAGLIIISFVAPPLVGGLLFSPQSLAINFTKLNPIAGLKRIFSSKIFAELFKCLLKVALITLIAGWFLYRQWPVILALPKTDLRYGFSHAMQLMLDGGLLIVISLMPMVGFDIFYQIWSNLKKLKMSKQEIKDEFKELQGDPQIKARIRQMQQAIARRRMMDDVQKADVVITNPSHYAVALQYDEKTMAAPRVLAKGVDHLAEKIKELAGTHNIPQLEAAPLARALYWHADIGKTIPAELYAAVAQVLAWIYQLKQWYRKGGPAPAKPHNLPVPKSLTSEPIKGESKSNE